jgi:hypothetical protein
VSRENSDATGYASTEQPAGFTRSISQHSAAALLPLRQPNSFAKATAGPHLVQPPESLESHRLEHHSLLPDAGEQLRKS